MMIPAIEVSATQQMPPAGETQPAASVSNQQVLGSSKHHQQRAHESKSDERGGSEEEETNSSQDDQQSACFIASNLSERLKAIQESASLQTPKRQQVKAASSATIIGNNNNSQGLQLIEKSLIIHRDENGFGLRVKGQSPVFVEHVHENGAAWRAGVRKFDLISKVNGSSVAQLDHKGVVLMFKSCSRFVGLTLLSSQQQQQQPRQSASSLIGPSSSTSSCLYHQRQSFSSFSLAAAAAAAEASPSDCSQGSLDHQFQIHADCLAAAYAERLTGNLQQQRQDRHWRSRRQRLLLGPSAGSTRTLLSLNLNLGARQPNQRCLLLADGENGEADFLAADNVPLSPPDCRHKSASPISPPTGGSPWSAQPMAQQQQQSADMSQQQQQQLQTFDSAGRQSGAARRSASVSSDNNNKPCYLSAAQSVLGSPPADKQNGDTSAGQQQQQAKGCACLSCQTLFQFARNREQQQQQRDDMDACEQCRLTRSSTAGFGGRLRSHRQQQQQQQTFSDELLIGKHRSGSNQFNDSCSAASKQNAKMDQAARQTFRQQQGISMTNEQTLQHYKMCQSASTSSLPAESQRNSETNRQQPIQSTTNPTTTTTTTTTTAAAANNNAGQSIPRQAIQQTNKRLEIIRELIDTERTHTERLRCLDELFYRPLKSGGFMTSEQLRMVFSCHRTLYKIHRQIYRILLSANYNLYPEPLIGSALIEIFEGDLKRRLERAACNFCASQSSNAELLNKLTRRDTKVGEFLAHVTSQQMVGRLGIKDLLASCFQRLTKYPLLLENLLKATPQAPALIAAPPSPPTSGRTKSLARPRRKVNNSIEGDEEEDVNSADDDDDDDAKDEGQNVEVNDEEEHQREEEEEEDEEERRRRKAAEDSLRMIAISLAEEREFIERALNQSRQILVRVNESVKVAISHNKLKEIWKRTDKYPGVPLIDITKQQVVHEGLLTLRLAKRSFDVYVLLLNDYLIILTREGQDKYRLKFFTPEGKSNQSIYSPVFVIDEHLTTRDAATDENGFYLLCKRKDDSRIYEFASRSPAERSRWRDKIQSTIERQMVKSDRRRSSCESAITKSSSEISSIRGDIEDCLPTLESAVGGIFGTNKLPASIKEQEETQPAPSQTTSQLKGNKEETRDQPNAASRQSSSELTKIEGTISLVEDDGIIQPYKMECSQALVDQAIQVNICDRLEEKAVASS